jgi:pimeloyl-ACP methyl ester carboxylesterase
MSRLLRPLLACLLCAALGAAALPATAPAAHHAKAGHHKNKAHKKKAHKKKAHKKKARGKKVAGASVPAVLDVPVVFHVRNTNTSKVPCAADGAAYDVRGHLVGPTARLARGPAGGVTLYAHGLGYGEFFWHDTSLPDYDYATHLAADYGQVSVTIDRLGYGASGRPDGNQVCYGSEADWLHQIVEQLRHGTYDLGGTTPPVFSKVALIGHSAGGFMVEAEAESYHDVDALGLAGFANTGASPLTILTFAGTQGACLLSPLPHNYAYFGATAQDFRAGHIYNAEPAVADSVVARRAPDPCMDTGSAAQAIVIDLLTANSIRVPTLMVHGSNDALFPPPAGAEEQLLFLGNPDVTQVTLAGTGHAMTFGRTAPEFRATVGKWLQKQGF